MVVVVVAGARRGRVKSSPILEDEAKDAVQIRLALPEPVASCRPVDPSVERSVAMMLRWSKVPL